MVTSTEKSTNHEVGFTEVIDRVKRGFGYREDADLARAIGMSPSAFSNRRKSGSVPYEKIIRAANQRNLNLELLFGDGFSPRLVVSDAIEQKAYAIGAGRTLMSAGRIGTGVVEIPRFDPGEEASAQPTIYNEVIVETLAVSEAFARAQRLVADRVVMIAVRESSMSPTLEHGDQVIVDRSVDRVVEDGVYAIHHAGALKIKRLQTMGDGSVLVLSDNPSYRPEVIGAADAAESLVVIGRVLPYKFGRVRL